MTSKEFKAPKRTDLDGETIITSAGFEDLDPESLVEPTELPPEEIEEEEERLVPKVRLCFNTNKGKETPEYVGTLEALTTGVGNYTIVFRTSLQDGLDLLKRSSVDPDWLYLESYPDIHYVYEAPQKLVNPLKWKLIAVSLNELGNSTCLCSVVLQRC